MVFLKQKLHFAQCFSREMMVKVIMIAVKKPPLWWEGRRVELVRGSAKIIVF